LPSAGKNSNQPNSGCIGNSLEVIPIFRGNDNLFFKGADMIKEITIQNFKRFHQPTIFQLRSEGITYLAGGNNSDKLTFLRALAVCGIVKKDIVFRPKDMISTSLLSGLEN